jgi:hypothetical protein
MGYGRMIVGSDQIMNQPQACLFAKRPFIFACFSSYGSARVRRRLGVIGVHPSKYIARIQQRRVGIHRTFQERSFRRTREPDRAQRTVHAAVGTAWDAPQTRETRDPLDAADLVRKYPFEPDVNLLSLASQADGCGDGLMCNDGRVVIADT